MSELSRRQVWSVSGQDRATFLQGLITQDVHTLTAGQIRYSACLNSKGKFLADFFLIGQEQAILIDIDERLAGSVMSTLKRYRLRAQVSLDFCPDLAVYAAWGEIPPGYAALPDPRSPRMPHRFLAPHRLLDSLSPSDVWDQRAYQRCRLRHGIVDGADDLTPDQSVILEYNFDEMQALCWTKGCYIGQELMARTKYRGVIRKRALPVLLPQDLCPARGESLVQGGEEVGTILSAEPGIALARLRLEGIEDIRQKLLSDPAYALKAHDLCTQDGHLPLQQLEPFTCQENIRCQGQPIQVLLPTLLWRC